jgi:CubicO group peptidase (beta-lactamase class C family)
MARHGTPGLAIGIVADGRVVYARAFGSMALGSVEPVTTKSLFHLASVTKLFTALAAMQLEQAGKLDLDAPVVRYLPYFRMDDHRFGDITVRHLLQHRAGIPFVEEDPFSLKPVFDDKAIERHVRDLAQQKLDFAPGAKFEYSNYGYDVLGDVIAKASGQSFESYVKQHVLRPAGMADSTLLLRETDAGRIPKPYYADQQGQIAKASMLPYTRAFTPSSNLYASVDDMNRWMLAVLRTQDPAWSRGGPFSRNALDQLWQLPVAPGATQFPVGGQMGQGWFRWNYRGRQLVGHGGADLGFNSFVALAPQQRIGVVVMGNLYPAKANYSPEGTYYTADIAKAVLDRILPSAPQVGARLLNRHGNLVETLHGLPLRLRIDPTFRSLGELDHRPTYEGVAFDVSMSAFADKDTLLLVHAERHADGSGGLDYSALKPELLGGMRFTARSQCVAASDQADMEANPEVAFLRAKGRPVQLPAFTKQLYATSPGGFDEVVLSIIEPVASCKDTAGVESDLDRKLRRAVTLRVSAG